MQQVADPNLVFVASDNGEEVMLNLSLVRMVTDLVSNDILTLHFSEQHRVTLHGAGANDVRSLLLKRSVSVDGSPVMPMIERALKARSPE